MPSRLSWLTLEVLGHPVDRHVQDLRKHGLRDKRYVLDVAAARRPLFSGTEMAMRVEGQARPQLVE